MTTPSSATRRSIRRSLLAWFDRCQRDLPWRRDRDPYRIWVSEIMLQQTQVATVIPYFNRFTTAFPTIEALAAADEQEVLRHWQGLGYYHRAKNLHRGARQLVAEHGGNFPEDAKAVARLPGVGRYTLGAILSQAFDSRLPILETNSQRVLARLLGLRDDPRQGPTRRLLWQAAEVLLPVRRVGEFNQALMELGALVCTPARPKCDVCPLERHCSARRLGLQESIPPAAPVPDTIEVRETAVVVRRGPRFLLAQRPEKGRWAGMWEFPHGPLQPDEAHKTAAVRLLAELTGLRGDIGPEVAVLRHAVTRYRITMVCFEATSRGGRFASSFYSRGRWLRPGELNTYPVSSPQRQLARIVSNPTRQNLLF